MSSSAAYASVPKIDFGTATTGDTSRTAPTNFATAFVAGNNGSVVERINLEGIGTTVASTLRLFLVKGTALPTITSITFSTTTATVTTASPHGMSTGNLITIQGVLPGDYNVKETSVTVTSTTVFTYTMGSTPTNNATTVGTGSYITTTPTQALWQELPISAITPSGTVQAFTANYSQATNYSQFPLKLSPAMRVRVSVNDTQTSSGINTICFGGDL